jgi:hypothetical protein
VLTWTIPDGVVYDSIRITDLTDDTFNVVDGNATTFSFTVTTTNSVVAFSIVGNYFALQTTPVTAYAYVNTPQPLTLTATQSLTTPANVLLSWSYDTNVALTTAPYTAFNIYVGGLLVTPPSPIDPFGSPQSQTIVLDPLAGPYTIGVTGVSSLGESTPIEVDYAPTAPPP